MAEETLPTSLQESLLALLAFNDRGGTTAAVMLKVEHFDAPYQKIARGLLEYRRQFSRPPDYAHLDDIFAIELERGGAEAAQLRRLLTGITELAKGLNADYLVARTGHFIEDQTFKAALMRAGEAYQSGGDDRLDRAKQIIYTAMRNGVQKMDAGTYLGDPSRALRFLDHRPTTYDTGIKQLDQVGFGATAGQLLLYIAPKGSGKSWFCVHMGRQGLIHRGKVLHISLEMDEEWVLERYIQSIFGVALEPDPYVVSVFEFDELHRLIGWKMRKRRPKLNFADPNIRRILSEKMRPWGLRLGAVIIKRFPSGSLTISQLEGYLDYLEQTERFIPTMLIVDYPDLMKIDSRNFRIDMGRIFVDLRGLAQKRNLATVAPTQGGRSAIGARRVRSTHVTEDISKVFTADRVISCSRTDAEALRGLARLYVDFSRRGAGGQEIVITQSYATGQYAIDSAWMSAPYWEQLKLAEAEEGGDD